MLKTTSHHFMSNTLTIMLKPLLIKPIPLKSLLIKPIPLKPHLKKAHTNRSLPPIFNSLGCEGWKVEVMSKSHKQS